MPASDAHSPLSASSPRSWIAASCARIMRSSRPRRRWTGSDADGGHARHRHDPAGDREPHREQRAGGHQARRRERTTTVRSGFSIRPHRSRSSSCVSSWKALTSARRKACTSVASIAPIAYSSVTQPSVARARRAAAWRAGSRLGGSGELAERGADEPDACVWLQPITVADLGLGQVLVEARRRISRSRSSRRLHQPFGGRAAARPAIVARAPSQPCGSPNVPIDARRRPSAAVAT